MLDSRLVQGLLIATCISLLCAIIITGVDIAKNHQTTGLPAAAAPAAPAQPPPAEEPAPSAEGEQTSALNIAPQGTWGVVLLDVKKALASPILRDKLTADWPAGINPGDVNSLVVFMLPGDGARPSAAGVLTFDPAAAPQIEAQLKAAGSPIVVAGASAYRIAVADPAAAAMGGMMGPGMAAQAPSETVFAAMAGDSMVLGASTEAELTTLLQASQNGGGLNSRLQQFLGQFSGGVASGAVLPTPEMLAEFEQTAGEPVQGLLGAGFKIDLDGAIALHCALRFSNAQQAQQTVDTATAKIAEMKGQAQADAQMAAMMQPMLTLLDKLSISARGTDARFSITLTEQEVQQAAQTAMMMARGGAMGGMESMGGDTTGGPSFSFE